MKNKKDHYENEVFNEVAPLIYGVTIVGIMLAILLGIYGYPC